MGDVRLECSSQHRVPSSSLAGIPAIREAQQARATQHVNLSATAAFLASVAATTLQYSQVSATDTPTATVTAAIWYASLGLAITSALLSLLTAVLVPYPQ